MKQSEIKKIIAAINEAFDEFKEDPDFIYQNDEERKKLQYDPSTLSLFKPNSPTCISMAISEIIVPPISEDVVPVVSGVIVPF